MKKMGRLLNMMKCLLIHPYNISRISLSFHTFYDVSLFIQAFFVKKISHFS